MIENKVTYLKVKDYLVSGESFDLLMDTELDMLITSPQPKLNDLVRYYESDKYISHTDQKSGIVEYLYQLVKKYSLRKKLRLIRSQNKKVGSLLDVGAGTGEFLKIASENQWKVKGVEPNQKGIEMAKQKGIDLYPELKGLEGETFDVITLWHVLEHIPNLEDTIEQLKRLLNPNGTLIIAVPNFKSHDAKHYAEFWAAYDVPRHLWHFSKKSIKRLFAADFQLQKISPMVFDSFYVSLLSEKYKTGKNFSLKAVWVGLVSNLRALKNKEYSSHIYIFKRRN